MSALAALTNFLVSYSNVFLLVAIGAMVAGLTYAKKSPSAARKVAIVSLCASAPLFVLYALASAYRLDILTLALTALWGWNCWSSWKTIRRTRPPKLAKRPKPAKPRVDRWN